MTDILLLSDVFEEVHNTCIVDYGLDPAHYLILMSYSWDCMLKYTEVNLHLK